MQTNTPAPVPSTTQAHSVQGRKTRPTGLQAGAQPTPEISPLFDCIRLVADDMQEAELELHQLVRSALPVVDEINRYLVTAGGKRLRPLITALGARAAGDTGALPRLMCVGELLHLGSLLHDDVVDEGVERRGRPAAHRVYGNPAAVLAGDVCLARSLSLASQEAGPVAVQHLSAAVVEMAEGEVIQLMHLGDMSLNLSTYTDIIQRKSARLIAWCAAAGAWRCEETVYANALERFGTEIGIAFQITDDVLDYVGEKRLTGKRRGQDLAEGKPTLPLVLAMEQNSDLRERLSRGLPSPERIPALIEEVCRSGATEQALQMARLRVAQGLAALSELPESPWRDALSEIAHYLVDRVS